MKIAIIGMPQAGQQELFSLLSGAPLETVILKPLELQPGVCYVRDPRVTKLSGMYNPAKTTYAKIEFSLLPDFGAQGNIKTLIFNELKNSDEICWVCRAETADADISNFIAEMAIYDLMLAEKRLDTIEKDQKRKFIDTREKEKGLMEICRKQLEAGKPLSQLEFEGEQRTQLKTYQFFSLKPTVIMVNVPEDKIKDASTAQNIKQKYSYPCIQLNSSLEKEISELKEDDRLAFMKEMGIDEPALDKFTRVVFEGLGLMSFFTVGTDEVRAWPVRRNASAAEAGAVIHSDIEKGFVKAELMKYPDLITAGSEAKVREQGKFNLKGRDYIVEDGDILSFRFNV